MRGTESLGLKSPGRHAAMDVISIVHFIAIPYEFDTNCNSLILIR